MKNGIPDEVIREIFPKKLKRPIASRVIYNQLKKRILSGKLKKGELLAEEQIAHNHNVSRVPVRWALRQLEEDKLVIHKCKKGMFVP